MKGRIDKRTWGVLGKQQTYYSPQQFLKGKTKTPLNANPFDSWDVKRSRFNRVDGYENAVQQGGVVPQVSSGPVASPTPTPSITPSPTPSFTPTQTQTQTPSLTPSSTPYPLPIQPNLWFDGSDPAYMSLIVSGGSNYLSTWTSKGINGWVMTAENTNQMCIVSGSSQMPGSPNIVRFVTGTTGNIKNYRSFNNSPLGFTGGTSFIVYAQIPSTTLLQLHNRIYTGTTNGGIIPIVGGASPSNQFAHTPAGNFVQSLNTTTTVYSQNITSQTAATLNNKYIIRTSFPNATDQYGVFEVNQSAATFNNRFTGSSATGSVNTYTLGCTISSGGTISPQSSNYEVAEIMWFNTTLSNADVEAVELYLKDKWRYDEWASPVPTPTQTASSTATPTASITATPTPSST